MNILLLLLSCCFCQVCPVLGPSHNAQLAVGSDLPLPARSLVARKLPGGEMARASQPARAADGKRDDGALEGGRERSKSLVIVLHGGSWKPRPVVRLARSAMEALSSEARRSKLRLLAPLAPVECRSTVPWLEPAGEAAIMSLLDLELAERRASADRVYLAGHGSGATAALVLASRHPERFAAVAAWSGTPPPLWDASQEVVGLASDPIPGLKGVPVYLWTGNEDPILDRGALRFFVEGMEAAAALDSTYELLWDRGAGGHDYGQEGPREGLKFLRAHRKQKRP
ncbi:MAG: pimeloyl-ACP methyl ester carboxylesterase [Pseudohongiellaceae bacterium]|jgi:pimeloyl-ACP methyl ester carboxylesterase